MTELSNDASPERRWIPAPTYDECKKNKADLLKPALQSTDTGYSLLQLLFCSSLFSPAIAPIKLAVFILRYGQSVYCLLNRYLCPPFLTDLTRIKVV